MTLTQFSERWIKDSEVPSLLGISKRTWADIKRTDKIPYSKRGNAKFIEIKDLNEWIEKNKVTN